MTISHDNPSLDELLSDPLTQAIMKADRVDPLKLEAMLRSTARLIGSVSGALSTPSIEAESA
jgi:hypothetical protein